MIYVESPIGVGFSYSNTSSDYISNDNITAYHNYLFLTGFYGLFPQYSQNKLWLTGESFAGDYIPQLVAEILYQNNQQIVANLEGFLVGNPVLSCTAWTDYHHSVQVNLYYWHGLVPFSLWNNFMINCNVSAENQSANCLALYGEIRALIGQFSYYFILFLLFFILFYLLFCF